MSRKMDKDYYHCYEEQQKEEEEVENHHGEKNVVWLAYSVIKRQADFVI